MAHQVRFESDYCSTSTPIPNYSNYQEVSSHAKTDNSKYDILDLFYDRLGENLEECEEIIKNEIYKEDERVSQIISLHNQINDIRKEFKLNSFCGIPYREYDDFITEETKRKLDALNKKLREIISAFHKEKEEVKALMNLSNMYIQQKQILEDYNIIDSDTGILVSVEKEGTLEMLRECL